MKGYRLFLKTKAELGHANIQYLLGEAYYLGNYDFGTDDEEALRWFRLSAEQGEENAMYAFAEHILQSDEKEPAIPKAVRLLKAAIKAENYFAAYRLGIFYLDAEGENFDRKQGVKYLRLAARNDQAEAQTRLGELYQGGHHVRQNLKTAMAWYQKAADQEDGLAMLRLGLCYEFGRGVEINPKKAFEFYESASENGNSYADLRIGLCRRYGKGCDEDDQIAFEKFTEAAEYEIEEAQYWLGICRFYGEGIPQNYGEALAHFEIASASDPEAYYWIGLLKRKGLGCRKDLNFAFECFLKAAEQGFTPAINALGRAFYFGEGISEDYGEAVKWLKLAVEENDDDAMYLLGMCYLEGDGVAEDEKYGLKLLEDSALFGNGAAKKSLTEMGFTLPEEVKNEGNLFEVGNELLKLSRIAYQKITASRDIDKQKQEVGRLIKFPFGRAGSVDQAMREFSDTK